MKNIRILPLLLVASLSACTSEKREFFLRNFYCFDSFVNIKIKHEYEELAENALDRLQGDCEDLDLLFDAYKEREYANVYTLNHTNDKVEIHKDLYNLFAIFYSQGIAKYCNPLIGSLSNKWKQALEQNKVLSDEVIRDELEKINGSTLILSERNGLCYAQRIGDALVDVGAIAKGYANDRLQRLLPAYTPTKDYLVDAGASSILLGTNSIKRDGVEEGKYVVKIKDLSKETYLHLNNCYISTSGISEQKTVIDNVTYSHIINPTTGSAVSLYDSVIVISNFDNEFNGAIGDMLSTSFMMSTLDDIKAAEQSANVQVVVIKDDSVLYKSESLELFE